MQNAPPSWSTSNEVGGLHFVQGGGTPRCLETFFACQSSLGCADASRSNQLVSDAGPACADARSGEDLVVGVLRGAECVPLCQSRGLPAMRDPDLVDLRYLQDPRFKPGAPSSWCWPVNVFEARMGANAHAGQVLELELEVAVRVLGAAALVAPGRRGVFVDLRLCRGRVRLCVTSSSCAMPPINADEAGNLLPALQWYQRQGVELLRVALMKPSFFWLPLMDGGE